MKVAIRIYPGNFNSGSKVSLKATREVAKKAIAAVKEAGGELVNAVESADLTVLLDFLCPCCGFSTFPEWSVWHSDYQNIWYTSTHPKRGLMEAARKAQQRISDDRERSASLFRIKMLSQGWFDSNAAQRFHNIKDIVKLAMEGEGRSTVMARLLMADERGGDLLPNP